MRQIVPAGGTWWRVVETLYLAMRNERPRSTVLYNKAKLGHDILKDVAEYNPATFENNDAFSAFVSEVQAFITTQSILQQDDSSDTDADDASDQGSHTGSPYLGVGALRGVPTTVGAPAAPADQNGTGDGEWDF
jgi:hypothetical protein